MPTHGTKRKRTFSNTSETPVHLSIAQGDLPDTSNLHQHTHGVCWTARASPVMLSNSLSSSSSDDKSFDEDDMYGSDSNIETISLRPSFHASSTGTRSPLVHVFLLSNMLSF